MPARVGSHVVAFTRDGLARGEIAHFEIAGDQLVADHVGPLRAALWEGEPRERLDELMAPVQRWALPEHVREHIADWKSLVITGRELADGLPFEALADQGGRRLGETRAVSHLPSLLVGQLLGARPLASTQRALPSAAVFAVTEPESDAAALHRLAPLRLDSEPLLVRNGQVVATQQGSAASRVAFAKTGSDPGSMLYLIAHGVRVGEWERPGGLVLADHVLSCDDVESVAAPRFVMLLSCGAGRALRRRGDSSGHHFGGAFLFAGASSVVFSDADLELDPAVALMRAFDAALPKCGWRPAEALRRARAAVTRNPATAHPRYSAVVRIEGLAQRSLLP